METAFLGRNLREIEDEDGEVRAEAGDERALGAERLDAGAPGDGGTAWDLAVVVVCSVSAICRPESSCQ